MRKLSFPRYVVVIAGSFSALINLVINLLVVGLFIVINGVELSWHALLIFPLILELFVFGLGVAFLLSALFVRFRDVNYIWELALQAGFYATPIIYPIAMVIVISETAAKLIMLNPVAQIIQDARAAVIFDGNITLFSMYGTPVIYAVPIAFVIGVTLVGAYYFKKRSPGFAEEI